MHTGESGRRRIDYENRFLLDRVPDFYDRLKGSYDENFFRQEVLGQYLNSRGSLVYKAFTRQGNLTMAEIDHHSPVCWAVDFNVDPMSSVIAQVRGGKVYVLDEIVLQRATTQDACEAFEKKVGTPRAGIVVYGDASGAAMQTTGFSDYAVIRDFFRQRSTSVSYRVPTANPAVKERIGAVNAKLRNARGDIELLISPRCSELIADLEQVSYLENSMQIDKNKDRRRTHTSDALGYLVHEEFRGAPVGERRERLF